MLPSYPQWYFDGERQVEPLQQPVGQLVESHTHEPPTHSCPDEQAPLPPHWHAPDVEQLSLVMELHIVHVPPPVPQVLRDRVWHVPLPSQQPLGHEVESHVHMPLTQCCPLAHGDEVPHWHAPLAEQVSAATGSHATQALPPVPQALVVGVVHTGPLQQPLRQLVELQPLQAPLVQVCPLGHAWQLPPPLPQKLMLVPDWHVVP